MKVSPWEFSFAQVGEVGMQMRRWLSVVAILSLWAICLSCGQNYRSPIIPIPGDPGDPKLYHFAMAISANNPTNPGAVTQIDVSGDSNVGVVDVGRGPVHAALLNAGSANRIYVANGLEDTVSTTTAALSSCGVAICPMGTVATITMPLGSSPSYLHSTEAASMYVILSGLTPPVLGVISTGQNVLAQQITLPVGNPVAMAELPNGHKLYVADQTNNAVYVLDTASRQIIATLPVGAAPSAVIASPDNSAVYVMNNAGVSVIDALTEQVVPGGLSTTGQPTSIAYDTKLNRLYVTDTAGRVGIFDAAVPAGTLPATLLIQPAGFVPCALGTTPCTLGVAPLSNGSRFYVLSQTGTTSLVLTAVDSTTLQATSSYSLDTLNSGGTAVPAVPFCGSARFRFVVGASGDGVRVYVSSCDAGGTYIFRTSDNTGVLMLASPDQPPSGGVTPLQNPVFLITGR